MSAVQQCLQTIKEQTQGQSPDQVEELILDQCHIKQITPELKKEIEKFPNLLVLSLNDCQLKSLDNLPNLPQLVKLELIDNKLSNDFSALQKYQELQSLTLGGNNINTFDDIKDLYKIQDLVELDFLECGISQLDNYRSKLFETFSKLEILDGTDKNGEEVEEEDEDDDEEFDEDDDDEEDGGEGFDEDDDDEEDDDEDDQPVKKVK